LEKLLQSVQADASFGDLSGASYVRNLPRALWRSSLSLLHATLVRPPAVHRRMSNFLAHPIFNSYHTEHELLRYLFR